MSNRDYEYVVRKWKQKYSNGMDINVISDWQKTKNLVIFCCQAFLDDDYYY